MVKRKTRQKEITKFILHQGSIPRDKKELAKRFHVSVSTIEKDLDEISNVLISEALQQIEQNLILNISKRIPEMKTSNLLRLLEHFVAKKQEIKGAEEFGLKVKMWNFDDKRKEID